MKTVICIPTYNERDNIESLIEEVLATVDAHVMVLDDDSPDGTGSVVEHMAQSERRLTVVHRKGRLGIGRAYLDGFRRALDVGYEAIFTMDGDYSHQPRFLPALFSALDHSDVAVGSRYVEGARIETWGVTRRALSYGANLYARTVFGMRERDLTAGFAGYRRHVLEAIGLDRIRSESYAFQMELKFRAHQLGFTITEVPIVFFDRVLGLSKIQPDRISEALMRVVDLRVRGLSGRH
ncbi:MAG: polyprenol monophosphomannose synthase [Myxococcota bacterium]